MITSIRSQARSPKTTCIRQPAVRRNIPSRPYKAPHLAAETTLTHGTKLTNPTRTTRPKMNTSRGAIYNRVHIAAAWHGRC
jgi:hypothetical protein